MTARPGHRAAALAAVAGQLSDQLATPPLPGPGLDSWQHQSLPAGAAGIALLHGARAQAGHGSPGRAHAWLSLATEAGVSAGPGSGLWFGAPAVAFAITASAPGQYRTASQVLNQAIGGMAQARLEAAHERISAAARPELSEYDLVRGLTGLGAYFLHCVPEPRLLHQILSYLVRLTEPVPAADAAGSAAPGWWTSSNPSIQAIAEGGHANLGMAHGIAGPLALLSLAMRQGITVAGQAEAIDRICAWLDGWCQPGIKGPWWPGWISVRELRDGQPSQPGPGRPSWCYGTPGLARALQLAAIARHDRARQAAAENALAQCISDPAQTIQLSDPGLCHGWAGTVTAAWHAALDATGSHLGSALEPLIGSLAGSARSDHPYGLMRGHAGAALALHTVATQIPGTWSRCLLIT
jgi:hypothetical protein